MPEATRNIGQDILDGIRQLKRGEHGRVVKAQWSLTSGKRPVCRSHDSRPTWGISIVLFRNGSKVGVHHRAQPEHCFSSRKKMGALFFQLPRNSEISGDEVLVLRPISFTNEAHAVSFTPLKRKPPFQSPI